MRWQGEYDYRIVGMRLERQSCFPTVPGNFIEPMAYGIGARRISMVCCR
jgi:hypothetical protein